MNAIFRKSLAVVVIILAISLATTITSARGGGHLWFYSVNPNTYWGDRLTDWPNPNKLPNPAGDWNTPDPAYVETDPDPWQTESIVIPPDGDWETPFSFWLACAQFESIDTMLVVTINDAAAAGIASITIDGDQISPVTITSWDTSGVPPGCLAPHGVFNSAEFHGSAEVNVGTLYSLPDTPYKTEITVTIVLNDGATEGMKIHFDAYGETDDGKCIFSPYSHDLTVIPELGPILLAAASFSALALYALKRRRYSP